ncbi:translocation/assembly module TamB domain-containing protein [Sphingobium sp. CR28]|uniref:translocation/assembly module TamB domain-containing protein n=1 Tax=Sphingobium sp. CR28 TaxID=3400272 RepID=UPI003FEF9628
MAELPEPLDAPTEAFPARRRKRRWIGPGVLLLVLLVLGAISGALYWIDTPRGHGFLIQRLAQWQTSTGLRITVGSIDGSIYKHARLRDVRFYDLKGEFARIDDAVLQWYPLGWLSKRLDVDHLRIVQARLDRLPALRPTAKQSSILPGFDVRVGELQVARLDLGAAIARTPQIVRLSGRAEILRGRLIVDLNANSRDTADAVRLSIDSRPDDRKFDIDAQVSAPAGGIIGTLAGVKTPLALAVRGDGDWRRWRGRLVALDNGKLTANVAIEASEGRYRLSGPLAMVGPLAGIGRQLRSSSALVDADFTLKNRVWRGSAGASVRGVRAGVEGGLDLGRNRFDDLLVDLRLADLSTLVRGAQGKDAALKARLSGPFDNFGLEYLLAVPRLGQGKTALVDLRAKGQGRVVKGQTILPLRLTARALALGSPVIDSRLRNLVADGRLTYANGRLTSGPVALRASGLAGRLQIDAVPARGLFAVNLDARLAQFAIPRFGITDVEARVRYATPGTGGVAGLSGKASAVMRRFDNAFLRGIAGGLPRVTSDLALAPDGRLLLRNLRLSAPAISIAGNGARNRDGTVHFEGAGTHRNYGPLRLTLDGQIDRPRVDLVFARPMDAARLADVHVVLVPDQAGYQMQANGGSMLGPFTLAGAVLLPAGADATINVARLAVSDVVAAGQLQAVTGGLSGRLNLTGPASGTTRLSVEDGTQIVAVDLNLDRARFNGTPSIAINRGTVQARIALVPGATSVDATAQMRGVRYGTIRVNRLAATAKLVNGSGQATASFIGQGGRLFDLQMRAAITPESVGVDLAGTLDQQSISQSGRAIFTQEDSGWRLAPVTYTYRGGQLRLGGLLGATSTHVEANLVNAPLALMDLINSDLGLGGTVNGSVIYDAPRGGVPQGRINVRVNKLTRSGLALSSTPIDLGINAEINQNRAAVRAVVADGGKVIGRAQALIAPLGEGSLMERLNAAPLRGQLRFSGNADTLWRLTNIELFALAGDVQITADATGTLADPQISGLVRARGGRIASPVTGMTLENVNAEGRFNGSQLNLTTLNGRTKNGGTVSGNARFTFSGERGVGMDVSLQTERATILDRDDIGATVTGPLRIQSDGYGGSISGNLEVVSSRFVLGRAAAVAQIPQLNLVEINRRGDEIEAPRPPAPWTLAIKATANNRFAVEGLGMQSEWAMNVDIGGTVVAPTLSGTANLVRGDYDFAGRRFELREGRLRFSGDTPINPVLDIRAVADVTGLSATISVTGTSLKPIIAFSSVPAMSQDELLARILFGTSIASLSAPEAIQLASAVAAFQGGGSGLDPINALRKATGLSRLRILPADTQTGQKTSIGAGKYITRRIYVELITDGQGYSATRVEYQITRWLALLSSVSTIGRQSLNARVSKDY